MSKRVSLSGEHQDLEQISKHYTDVTDSVRIYYQPGHSGYNKRFQGYSAEEMKQERNRHLREIDRASALAVLSAVEAAFIIDYLQRCYMKKRMISQGDSVVFTKRKTKEYPLMKKFCQPGK